MVQRRGLIVERRGLMDGEGRGLMVERRWLMVEERADGEEEGSYLPHHHQQLQ